MALPKIDLPLMEVVVPSTGEKVKFRPFTVKEEKVLLVAQESEDPAAEILAMRQIVNNCVVDVNTDEFAIFDLEFLIMNLRAASVDNKIKFSIADPDTDESVELEFNISELTINKDNNHSNEIKLNENYTLFLKYPNVETFVKIAEANPEDPLTSYYIMTNCLDKVASEDEIEYFKDYTDKEIETFMDDLPGNVLKKIVQFFETMPKLRHEVKYTNSEGKEQTFVIEGTRSFFI